MNEEVRHFSLRKLSVGLASVLVGVSIFGASQTVKADTVADQTASAVTGSAQNSDTQENGNAAESSFSNDNQAVNAKNNMAQTQENESKQDQAENVQQDSAPKTQEVNNGNNLGAEKNAVRAGSLQEPNNHAEDNSQTQTSQKLDLTKNNPKFNQKVLATNLIETTSSPTTNGGFDEATWGKLDVNDWQGSAQDGLYQLTKYTGDFDHVIVPNEADFEKAGKSTNGLQVGISSSTIKSLFSNLDKTFAFSKTNDQKVKAIGTDWSETFAYGFNLSKFDGSNLDVSNVTNMRSMFSDAKISNLNSLDNWDVSHVTNMRSMFDDNQISDLTPLKNWNTSEVTNMADMFDGNKISDLTPLKNWNTSKVTDMSGMFYSNFHGNSISDLTPLKNWDTSEVTNMSYMFLDNKISDLAPLANWKTGKVTNMSHMFSKNKIRDLTPLTNWKTSNVTNMSGMFSNFEYKGMPYESIVFIDGNKISDLAPLTNWDVSNVTDMSDMFESNSISDLSPLANWNISKVTDMSHMFAQNPDIKDLKPVANRDVRSVAIKNLDGIFSGDTQLDLTDINNTQFMQDFLKLKDTLKNTYPLQKVLSDVLQGTTFITNNVDLVKMLIVQEDQELPIFTDTATRTILFNFPDGTSKTITQHIYYKTIAPVQIEWPAPSIGGGSANRIMMVMRPVIRSVIYNPVQAAIPRIIKKYTIDDVKASDWQLDTSQTKPGDVNVVNGQVYFKPVPIPHVNGYKARIVRDKINPMKLMVSFMAVPIENKPSTPIEVAPSKPAALTDNPNKPTEPVDNPSKSSAPTDNANKLADDLQKHVATELNGNDSGWTMPTDVSSSTYTVDVPADNTIDLSDLVIAEPVHAQTRTQIHVTKRFKLSKKHLIKHLKHRKLVSKLFSKRYVSL